MVCQDCGDQGAECLTAERVRVCTSCLYERTARERDALRDEVARCHDSLREADRVLRQAYAERNEALERLRAPRQYGIAYTRDGSPRAPVVAWHPTTWDTLPEALEACERDGWRGYARERAALEAK